jgi:hypothetical protein
MSRFYLPEEGHVVNILPPVDLSGGPLTADRFSMEGWAHASIILQIGANAAGASVGVTVKECDAATGGSATAIVFDYYAELSVAGDTLGVKTTTTTAGPSCQAGCDWVGVITPGGWIWQQTSNGCAPTCPSALHWDAHKPVDFSD